jgi:hypothetical protein
MAYSQVKTTSGHLTALDKRAVLAMLNAGASTAKTARNRYRMEGNAVWVDQPTMEWSGPSRREYRAEFVAK